MVGSKLSANANMNEKKNKKNAEQVFLAMLERNRDRFNGIARVYASTSECDDLLQEIVLQVWRSLGNFDQKAHIDTWAYRVALNTALSWGRKIRRRKDKLPEDNLEDMASLSDFQSTTANAERRMLDGFIASLSKSERAVFLLHLDDLGQDAASDILGISSTAYRVRVHRLKKKFEQTFQLTSESKNEL